MKYLLKLQPYFTQTKTALKDPLLSLTYKALTVCFLLYSTVCCSPVIINWVLRSTGITKTTGLQNTKNCCWGFSGQRQKEEADQGEVYFLLRSFQGSNSQQSLKNHWIATVEDRREYGVSGWDGSIFRWLQCHGKHYKQVGSSTTS